MQRTVVNENRHEKAVEYALNIIRNSKLAPYVKALYLYGSYARGTYKYSSDIDLFLVLEESAREFRSEILELKSDVTDTDDFDGVEADMKIAFGDAWLRSQQSYHENIRRDGIDVWKKKSW